MAVLWVISPDLAMAAPVITAAEGAADLDHREEPVGAAGVSPVPAAEVVQHPLPSNMTAGLGLPCRAAPA